MKTLTRQILNDPSTHFWLKSAIETALTKNPVDAIRDAEILLAILKAEAGQ
jgi:hypothetical protein